jgi:hypothetical protein
MAVRGLNFVCKERTKHTVTKFDNLLHMSWNFYIHGLRSSKLRTMSEVTAKLHSSCWILVTCRCVYLCTDTPIITQWLSYVKSGVGRNWLCTIYWLYMHKVNLECIYESVQSKSRLQNTGTRAIAAWQPCRLCNRPAVFSQHHRFAGPSFTERKIRAPTKNVIWIVFMFWTQHKSEFSSFEIGYVGKCLFIHFMWWR